MERIDGRTFSGAAVLGWLGVGAYGVWEIASEAAGEGGETPYVLFSIALFAAAALTIAIAWESTRGGGRSLLRRVGLGVCLLGLASTIAAWALPLWMTLFGVGFALVAAAAPRERQRGFWVLSAAQLIGMAVLFVGLLAEVGPEDSYGDYPVAFGIGLVVTAAASVIGLADLEWTRRRSPEMTKHDREAPRAQLLVD